MKIAKVIILLLSGFIDLLFASFTTGRSIFFCGQIFTAKNTDILVPQNQWSICTIADKRHQRKIRLHKYILPTCQVPSSDYGPSLTQEPCKDQGAKRIATFHNWLRDRGVRGIGTSVRIAPSGSCGYGMFCVRDIEEGEVILSIPDEFNRVT
jgi:hypothetical protein